MYCDPLSQDPTLFKPPLTPLAQVNQQTINEEKSTSNPTLTQSGITEELPANKLNMGYCIRKEYIRLIKTKLTKQKKNQIPNLPLKVREKLYEIARKKYSKTTR